MKKSYKISGKTHVLKEGPSAEKDLHFIEQPGGWWIAESKSTGERFRVMAFRQNDRFQVSYQGELFNGIWTEGLSSDGKIDEQNDSNLEAQFPGKIRKILVKIGEKVSSGAPLLLVEAMKMEFSITAPYASIVEKINVTEGQQVMPGTKYIILKKNP